MHDLGNRKGLLMGNELAKLKLKQNLILIGVFIILGTLIAYNALRPDPEEVKIAEMKDIILSQKDSEISSEERLQMREMIEKLPPNTRKKLITEVMRGRLEQMREENVDLTEMEKKDKVKEVVTKMRQRFTKMTLEQRNKAKERMNSPEGKKMMNEALGFFYKEFSPQERELMTPIIDEFSIQMGQ